LTLKRVVDKKGQKDVSQFPVQNICFFTSENGWNLKNNLSKITWLFGDDEAQSGFREAKPPCQRPAFARTRSGRSSSPDSPSSDSLFHF